MTDKITESPYQREAANEANRDLGDFPGVLSGSQGERILNKYEEAEDLKAQNVRDPLTGAFNRRYFDAQTEARLQSGRKFSLIMTDIDHFKSFNDAYGHKNGDRLLVEVIRTLSNHLRLARPNGAKDFIARYGGDEFAIVLADVDKPELAKEIADNLRKLVAESKFKIDNNTNAVKTLSMGVAVSREFDNADELVVRADKALYQAKDIGRNRVELSKD